MRRIEFALFLGRIDGKLFEKVLINAANTDYDSSTQGCNVCGHTLNQNNKFKKLSDTGIPCTYCYRVKTSLGGDGTEKAIDLTNGNSHAI